MTTRSMMVVLVALIAFTGAVAQAHVPAVFNEDDRLLDRDPRSLQDDPFKMYRCYLRIDHESSGSPMRTNGTRNAELCLLPTPPQQEITPNLAIEA